jgi:hypothetical protein
MLSFMHILFGTGTIVKYHANRGAATFVSTKMERIGRMSLQFGFLRFHSICIGFILNCYDAI